ncbi:MAG: cytochrome c biogenesis protein CcsA, partial [Gemmatimonadetes bacterium]|nr:cytochrome c biogenesis protein CcsA [Gemmatimonadota bacterium]
MIREKAEALARRGSLLTAVALLALAGVYLRALMFTPIERFQGPAQKIFYVHAPAAWSGLLAFAVTGLLSVLYLWLRDRKVDLVAAASAEVGLAFSVIMLTTGPIWAKPIWGTWWTWDARLTSTLFIFLLFVGYQVLRGAITDHETRARYSAVIGILGLVLVPFIHMTVYLFRTLHPDPVVMKPGAPSLPAEMQVTLFTSLGVFTLLYLGFLAQRYALGV